MKACYELDELWLQWMDVIKMCLKNHIATLY